MPSDYSQACITLDVQKSRGEEGAGKSEASASALEGQTRARAPAEPPSEPCTQRGEWKTSGVRRKGHSDREFCTL